MMEEDLERRILFSVYNAFWSYYDYIYDIISDPRFFHFQDKSNENEKDGELIVHV